MSSRLHELNPPQREAVITTDGPLLVLAGAGSGKTRVITYRVAHLLDTGAPADQILAVSFTNKSADEMEERVHKLVGKRGRGLTLCTFHALGLTILKAERAALGMERGFTIYDQADQLGLVRELLRQIQIEDRRFDAKAILFRLSLAKNAFLTPEEYRARVEDDARDDEYDLIAAELYPRYEAALQSFHALDFDDLITRTVRLLDADEEARERWATRFRWVMVDEYQDTNRAQFKLMEHLVRRHNNLCVVGDDDQSIYGWRGAEAGHILEFERQFPGARVVRLEQNYRSTPQILGAANGVIRNNKKRHDKTLWTAHPDGEKLRMIVAEDAEAEAKFVAEEIEILRATRGHALADCAVLYRSNVQAKPLEEALRAQRIDYEVIGGQSFFERKEVKDAIAYVKLALHPRDEIALRRIINYPTRGIGATTVERLAEWAKARGVNLSDACHAVARAVSLGETPPLLRAEPVPDPRPDDDDGAPPLDGRARAAVAAFADLIERGRTALHTGVPRDATRQLLEDAGLFDDIRAAAPSQLAAQRRLEHLDGFLESLGRFGPGQLDELKTYLHRLTLKTNDDDADESKRDRVTLVTLHGAKGLEFPIVFLVGMEEELLPHRRTLYPQGPDVTQASAAGLEIDLGEERRLMYVGITRARKVLYLTRARTRAARGGGKPRSPSRFLDEIPADLYETREASIPSVAVEDEEAFARASLAKLRQLLE
jgi:DNA helicase-2/ATP-dependent DNA helicase PcrA